MIMTTPCEAASSIRDISQIIGNWRQGGHPSTKAVLLEHPELRDYASVVVKLAHEEYCLRRDAGERVAASTFCEMFPTVRGKLRRLLEVEDALLDWPLDEEEEVVWPALHTDFLEFELLSVLGEGAAARVYLARQRSLGNRYVALKISRFGGSEAETLGKLQHPHVVPVFSVHFDEEQQLTAVCMPYLGGATLRDVAERAFRDGAAPVSAEVILEAARNCQMLGEAIHGEEPPASRLTAGRYVDGVVHLIAALADGLAYTHRHQVMHRDLKPSNVLVTPQGRPMLLDFNLSWDADLEISRLGGTLPYMPSEQIYATFFADESSFVENDPRTDIFSLGVILYELLTGRHPFPTSNSTTPESLHQLLAAHAQGPVSVQARNPDVSDELAGLIASCLAQDPEQRPPTAADLAARLRDLLPLAPGTLQHAEAQTRRRGGTWTQWLAVGALCAAVTPLPFVAGRYEPPPAPVSSAEHHETPRPTPSRAELLKEAEEIALWGEDHELDQAYDQLMAAESIRPEDRLFEERAFVRFRQGYSRIAGDSGSLKEAISLLVMKLELANLSDDPDTLSNLGYCYLVEGQLDAAKQHLNQALRVAPEHSQALMNRSLCEFLLHLRNGRGNLKQALHDAEAAAEVLGSHEARVHLHVAIVHAEAAKLESDKARRRAHDRRMWGALEAANRLGIDPVLVRQASEFPERMKSDRRFVAMFGNENGGSQPVAVSPPWTVHYVPPSNWQ
jgi:serine/threonine protein kinase